MKTKLSVISLMLFIMLTVSACGVPSLASVGQAFQSPSQVSPTQQAGSSDVQAPASQPGEKDNSLKMPSATGGETNGLLATMQGSLEKIYEQVNPSVVNIEVTSKVKTSDLTSSLPFDFSSPFNMPDDNQPDGEQVSHALGSGFVWDDQGHIVTNNHVVNGADKIMVRFSDGSEYQAKVVGNDPSSDLAVIQVTDAGQTVPLQLSDSDQVKVGDLAIAIGNPYGLQGTMTVGYVSALGRSITSDTASSGSTGTYTIPDVIQTDASINPGNSGGVLLDDQGYVIGVTSAIESSTRSNAGIGFVIPSNIVNHVVPELIKSGKYDHPYIGISGTDVTADIRQAMKLDNNQRGALVVSVTSGGPADKAGLKGSTQQEEIDGSKVIYGGDIIVSINGQKINEFDDVVSYLFKNSEVGDTLKLGVLRDGQTQTVDLTLEARPTQNEQAANKRPQNQANGKMFLGIVGITLDSTLNDAMKLDKNQQGVLVAGVADNSPASQAGLKAGNKAFSYHDNEVKIGGDVITAVDGREVKSVQELQEQLSKNQNGDKVQLTVIRDGKEMKMDVTLSDWSPYQ